MRTMQFLLLLLCCAAAPAVAQRTVGAGMTEAEVVSALGAPSSVRQAGTWTYLFYANGCSPRCGSADVVFLQEGRVVTALFRTRARSFSGPAPAVALRGFDEPGVQRAAPEAALRDAEGIPNAPSTPPTAREAPASASDPAQIRGIRLRVRGTEGARLDGGADAEAARYPSSEEAERAADRERGVLLPRATPNTIDFTLPSDTPRVAPERRPTDSVTPGVPRGRLMIRDAAGTDTIRSRAELDAASRRRRGAVRPAAADTLPPRTP
ncbi:hypothetical protein BH23GEM4_BH23GEM4_07820 [soil metagenome]